MIDNPIDGRLRPSAVVSFMVAALFLLLALWSGTSGEVWALGLALVGGMWVVLGIRAVKRKRSSP